MAKKVFNPFFVRRMALIMSICYVMNLLQYQVLPVLHSISHVLEAPTDLIAHNSLSAIEHEIHEKRDHGTWQTIHQHEIIDLIDSIFEASTEKNSSDETLLTELKFHKYIDIRRYQKKKVFKAEKTSLFWARSQKLSRGHFQILQEPPQSS
ncbi:MAG: hypothetical protein ACR2MT_18580 [Aurantibacter sp.]